MIAHLVLEEDWRIEVRDLGINRLADDLTLCCMHEAAHL